MNGTASSWIGPAVVVYQQQALKQLMEGAAATAVAAVAESHFKTEDAREEENLYY